MSLPFSQTYLGKLRAKVGQQRLFVPGFRIVIEDDKGRILLIKRSDNGMWGLPAGSPETGESILDCIKREVKEETGLMIGEIGCFGFASDPSMEISTYPNGDQIHSYSLLVFSRSWTGRPGVSDHEATDVRFFAYGDFPEERFILKNELGSIRRYREFREIGEFCWT